MGGTALRPPAVGWPIKSQCRNCVEGFAVSASVCETVHSVFQVPSPTWFDVARPYHRKSAGFA